MNSQDRSQQYEYFKFLYEEENSREAILTSRCQIYLGICTFFLGGIAWKSSDIYSAIGALSIFSAFATIAFAVAVYFILMALKIREYEIPGDLKDILTNEFPDEGYPDSDEFHLNRLVDFAVATNENSKVNDNKSDHLQNALYFIVSGLGFTTALIFVYTFTIPDVEIVEPTDLN